MKIAAFAWCISIFGSYAVAMNRPLPALEASQADIGLLRIFTALGTILIAADGVPDWRRFVVLARRLALGGGLLAALGIVQFLTARSWTDWISIPGFVHSDAYSSLGSRGGFTRPTGTALHPLEFAGALAVVFPIALSLALYDRGRPSLHRWLPAAAVAIALILSGSRSGYLGLAIGTVVLGLGWPNAVRLRMLGAGIVLACAVFVLVPGMVGNIRGMFLGIDSDPSIQSRTGSFEIVRQFVDGSPVFGRGFGTFLTSYRILDNQVLLLLVEVGVVGVLIFFWVAFSAAIAPLVARRLIERELARQLGLSLTAGVIAGTALMFYFDAFSFPIAFGLWCLAVGMCANYWKLARADLGPERTSSGSATRIGSL